MALGILDTWLYDGDPAEGILVEDALSEVEASLDTDFFPELLRELFLDDTHIATVILVPSHSYGAERDAREKARLQAEKAAWSAEAAQKLTEQAAELIRWQQTPDSPEAAATVPVLQRSDLKQSPEALWYTVGDYGGIPVLRHETKDDLARLNFLFDASDLSADELPTLALLATLLGTLGTKRCSGAEVQLRIKEHIGRLELRSMAVPGADAEHCCILLRAAVTALPEQAAEAAELLAELLSETVFDDRKLLRDILRKKAMEAQMAVSANGHQFAVYRVAAYQTAFGAAREMVSGAAYVQWLKWQSEAEDEALDGLLARLRKLAAQIFRTGRMTVSCGAETPDALIRTLVSGFPASQESLPEACLAPFDSRREGIVIPAAVGYAAKGGNLQRLGLPWHGSLPVLANILNYEFLWPQIRVGGGAYGCGFLCPDSGELSFYTYRDPQPGRSMEVMDQAQEFLRTFCDASPDLDRCILGSVFELDPLLTDAQRMSTAENRYFRGVTEDDVRLWYQQLIHTAPEDLLSLGKLLTAIAEGENACVIAGESLIHGCNLTEIRI